MGGLAAGWISRQLERFGVECAGLQCVLAVVAKPILNVPAEFAEASRISDIFVLQPDCSTASGAV